MIKINELIKSVSSMIYETIKDTDYKCKITDDDDQLQLYLNKGSCFFIDVHIENSKSVNLHFNKKSLVIDIRYFPHDRVKKSDLNEIKELLETQFVRSIKVGRRYIHISDIDTLILKDEVGYTLNFSIKTSYHEQVYFDKNDSNVIEVIRMRSSDVLKIESEVWDGANWIEN